MLIAHAIPSGPDVYVCERTRLEITAEGLPVIQEAWYIANNNKSDTDRPGIFISYLILGMLKTT